MTRKKKRQGKRRQRQTTPEARALFLLFFSPSRRSPACANSENRSVDTSSTEFIAQWSASQPKKTVAFRTDEKKRAFAFSALRYLFDVSSSLSLNLNLFPLSFPTALATTLASASANAIEIPSQASTGSTVRRGSIPPSSSGAS